MVAEVQITEYWMVRCYNELDADFGYDCGAFTIKIGLDKATAKSIARGLNKKMRRNGIDFCYYFAEEEPRRYW